MLWRRRSRAATVDRCHWLLGFARIHENPDNQYYRDITFVHFLFIKEVAQRSALCPFGVLRSMGGIGHHPGALPGRDTAILTEPTSSQANGLKTRRIPTVRFTLCWATVMESNNLHLKIHHPSSRKCPKYLLDTECGILVLVISFPRFFRHQLFA